MAGRHQAPEEARKTASEPSGGTNTANTEFQMSGLQTVKRINVLF